MFIGISNVISGIRTAGLSYIKDNLKLYLDFKKSRSDTLAFPSEGSTSFDGNDVIKAGNLNDELRNISNLTVSAWIYPTHTGTGSTYYSIVNQWDYSSVQNWGLWLKTNGATDSALHWNGGGNASTGVVQDATERILTNQWTHICATKNGTAIKLYVNGSEVQSGTDSSSAIPDVEGILRIGSQGASGSDSTFFKGKMANVGLWSRVLSPEEVQSVMNKSYSQLGSVEKTSLVSWWAMDTMSGEENTLSENGGRGVITDLVSGSGSENLGTELVPNNIITSTQFSVLGEAGGSITNGVLRINTSGASQYLYDGDLLESGKIYKIVAVVSDATSGALYFRSGNKYAMGLCGTVGTHIAYVEADSTNLMISRNSGSEATDISVNSLSVREVFGNTGLIKGATTTTSVYGGNAPVLPRAIDIAESQAEAIGNGSADFSGSTSDYIALSDRIILKGDFSITGWKNRANETQDIFISESTSGNTLNYIWTDENGKVGFDGQGWTEFNFDTVITHSEWVYFAITRASKVFKLYINGILSDTIDKSSDSGYDADWSFNQFGRYAETVSYAYDGKLAQIGAFQGALSQSQVQSVMESTSYAKIPAEVKSTLGSEVNTLANALSPTNEANATTGLTTSGTISSVTSPTTSSDYSIKLVTTENTENITASNAFTVENGKLYKFSVTWKTDSSSHLMKHLIGTSSGNASYVNIEGVVGSTEWVTSDYYFVTTSTALNFMFAEFTGDSDIVMYIDNISIKKVTNDLVGYWSLDADNSNTSNGTGITNDLTTGETLSEELVGDPSFDTGGADNITGTGTDANVTSGALVFTDPPAPATGSTNIYFKKGGSHILESGKLYKFVFTIANAQGSGARLQILFDVNSSTGGSYSDHQNYTDGTHTLYTISNSTNAQFNISGASPSFKMTDVSIKQVTSNTGVLK